MYIYIYTLKYTFAPKAVPHSCASSLQVVMLHTIIAPFLHHTATTHC